MTFQLTAPTPRALAAEYRAARLWDEMPLRDGIERIANIDGERLAIIDNDGAWTYSQLRDNIEAGVGTLVDAGVASGDPVVLVAPNSRNAVATILAVVRAGGCAVVIDRRCGALDLANAITSSGASLVVLPDVLAPPLRVRDYPVVTISIDAVTNGRRVDDWSEPDPASPRLVTFTSGTTKRAKGVIHTWETMGAGVKNLARSLEFSERDRTFTSSPIATMTGLSQVIMALNGASLLLEDRFDPSRSLDAIEEHRATVIGGAPVILEVLFAEYERQARTRTCLERIALGGTTIPRSVLEVAVERFRIRPTRVYGSSEVPVHTCSAASDTPEQRLSDDGTPSPGSACRLGDAFPEGQELLVRGPNLFQGYLHNDDNQGAFVDGWFRTGDLVRLRNGRVKVLGRLKDVAARKGLKISLAEVDDAAKAVKGIYEAAAYAMPDDSTGERVALAIHVEGELPSYQEIANALIGYGLARGKLPEEIVFWREPLPRNASGKIVRAQLRQQADSKAGVLAPRLAAIVKDD